MLTPREEFFSALRFEETGGTPWLPLAGVHAGRLTGQSAHRLYRDGEGLLEALLEVNRQYEPCAQPVFYDLQLEAECLGCELSWTPDGPPAVCSHPLAGPAPCVPCTCMLPGPEDGRIPLSLETTRQLKAAVGERTALCGVVCGPFTLAVHLRGAELFFDLHSDGDFVRGLLDFCGQCAQRMAQYHQDAGADVILVADPLLAQLTPEYVEGFLSAPLSGLLGHIRGLGLPSLLAVCSDGADTLEALCRMGPDGILTGEETDLPAAKQITDRHGVAIAGNLPLESVLRGGRAEDNMRYMLHLLDAVGHRRGLILATGCDMPYDVPPENARAAALATRRPEEARALLAKGGDL